MYNRPITWIAIGGAVAVGAILAFFLTQEAKTPDVVEDVPAMSSEFADEGRTIGAHLATLPPSEHASYLAETWPDLQEKVLNYLRSTNRIPFGAVVDKVEFAFSSGRGEDGKPILVTAEQNGGPPVLGSFENELIVSVSLSGEETPRQFFVECLNGMVSPLEELALLTAYQPPQPFTVETGRGLSFYTKDDVIAIQIAESCELPLFRGQTRERSAEVTPEEAWAINTDDVQVTVGVLPGDYINPQTMTCTLVDGRRYAR